MKQITEHILFTFMEVLLWMLCQIKDVCLSELSEFSFLYLQKIYTFPFLEKYKTRQYDLSRKVDQWSKDKQILQQKETHNF